MEDMNIQNLSSLLEQCVLLNDASYRPFLAPSSISNTNSDAVSCPKQESSSQIQDSPTAETSDASSTTKTSLPPFPIDLDFNVPLTSSIVEICVPMALTTNRRKHGAKFKKRVPDSSEESSRKRKHRSKAAPLAEPVQPEPAPQAEHDEVLTSRIGFLSLPREIRDLIYNCLFEKARMHVYSRTTTRHAFDLHLAIRGTCKSMYAETTGPLFRHLEIILDMQSTAAEQEKAWISIPDHVLSRLETLSVCTKDDLSGLTCPPIKRMTSLQRLKLLEIKENISDVSSFNTLVEQSVDFAESLMRNPREQAQHWLKDLDPQDRRSFSISYEKECWGKFYEDRAIHMGRLKRKRFQTILVACSEKAAEAVSKVELTADQFRQRREMYRWMGKDSKRVTRREIFAYQVLRRLEEMEYHETLDKIEAGTAKTLTIAIVVTKKARD